MILGKYHTIEEFENRQKGKCLNSNYREYGNREYGNDNMIYEMQLRNARKNALIRPKRFIFLHKLNNIK